MKGLLLLPIVVTLLVVIATGAVLLLNGGCTGLFMNARPRGDAAMGLVVPILGLGGAILVLTLASLLAALGVSRGAAGAITTSPLLAGVLVVALTFGAALASGMAFMLWCEPGAMGAWFKAAVVPVGIVLGICGPLALAAMLLVGVWMPKSAAESALAGPGGTGTALRAGFVAVCLLAVAGYGLGGSMFWKDIERRAGNRAAALAEAIGARGATLVGGRGTDQQRLTEELAALAADAPLWSIVAYLPDRLGVKNLSKECRAIVVERALNVPDLDRQLDECMRSREYLYRQGAAEFLMSAPEAEFTARRDAWGRALLAGLEATGVEIECRPSWLTETFDSKPDPLGHVRSLLEAADRFRGWSGHDEMRGRLQKLADDAGMLNANSSRDRLMKMLGKAGYQAHSLRP